MYIYVHTYEPINTWMDGWMDGWWLNGSGIVLWKDYIIANPIANHWRPFLLHFIIYRRNIFFKPLKISGVNHQVV